MSETFLVIKRKPLIKWAMEYVKFPGAEILEVRLQASHNQVLEAFPILFAF